MIMLLIRSHRLCFRRRPENDCEVSLGLSDAPAWARKAKEEAAQAKKRRLVSCVLQA